MATRFGNRNSMCAGGFVALYLVQWVFPALMLANPTGPAVVGGSATVSGVGTAHVTVNQASQRAILNWQSFNIAPNEVTQFNQPTTSAIALNRIFDQNPSQIMGSLRANGTVMLVNPNGVFFGSNAQVNVGGLVASSLNISNANFLAGHYLFEGSGIEGAVKNLGLIRGIHDGVYLLAPNVENSGIITTAGGNILLAAGAKAYLSSRPDGRGFLAELSAPAGQATNVKDLIADGGHITLAGRVVNQQGLIQANSVRERNGKVELFASEQLSLKAGSQTTARGGSDGTSNGGTILAVADKTKGTTSFERGARIDVAGGAQGGHAGFTEVSGNRVKLGGSFVGSTLPGYRGGRLLIDPDFVDITSGLTVTDFSNITVSSERDALGNLLPEHDLTVTGMFELSAVKPPAAGGTIRFDAGRDLIFSDVRLTNLSLASPAKWDIVGVAERDIMLTGFTGTTLQTAHGGGISLQAKGNPSLYPGTGNVNLSDPQSGILSTVRVEGSGTLSIKTAKDLKASTGVDPSGFVQGISIDGPGRLNLDVGGDFIGGFVNGVGRGPGFVLWNSDPSSRPQHTVTVSGKIGETNLPLGPNGLPLTVAQQRAQNPSDSPVSEVTDKYADFALSGGVLTVSAGGNIYIRRVQDAGLVGGLDAQFNPRVEAFAPGLEHNKVTMISRDGNIVINTTADTSDSLPQLRSWLPASVEARAENGSIQIRSNLTFLPSPTGSVKFFAKQDIQGVPTIRRIDDPNNFDWIWIGTQGVPGGRWEVVDLRTINQRPDLSPYLQNLEKTGKPPLDATRTPKPDVSPGFTYPDFNPPKWPLDTKIDVDSNLPIVRLVEADSGRLVGNIVYSDLVQLAQLKLAEPPPLIPSNSGAPASVSFKAEQGDISKLGFHLVSRLYKKEILIEAGNRIDRIDTKLFLPNLGARPQLVAERVPLILDQQTNQPRAIKSGDVILIRAVNPQTQQVETRPWNGTEQVAVSDLANVVFRDVQVLVATPNVAATIKAKDIRLDRIEGIDGGLDFFGPGTARIIATNNLDLGTGRGISFPAVPNQSNDRGGLIDIAVGNKLDMVTSSIATAVGTGVSIHGYNANKPFIVGYDNSALYPSELPESAREGLNLPAAAGKINVGENSARSAGAQGSTGIQVVNGGSVGQRAREPVVNADGSVAVAVSKDPAAILILARGDVDVNKSRIATFRGGDIRITSTNGNINAGSGSRNDRATFNLPTGKFDDGGQEITIPIEVPGSGIFTFHPDDPKPLVFPTFRDPEISALLAQAAREKTFGRDVSALEAKANQLRADRLKLFEETVLNPHIDKLKLADISLTAETGVRAVARDTIPADGSGRIIIPEAGIQGRNVKLNGVLDFRGGSVTGRVLLPPNAAVVGQPSFVGGAPPPGVAPPPPPLTGGGSAAAASSTAASTGSSVKNADATQEAASESSSKQTGSDRVASSTGSKKDEETKLAKAVRVKRGVVIQVDVKPQAPSAN